jgi:hypothetical protein
MTTIQQYYLYVFRINGKPTIEALQPDVKLILGPF